VRVRGQLIRRYFVTGLLIWVPLAITAWVLSLIVGTLDKTLHVLPSAFHPKQTLGVDLPGAGVILTLLIIFLTGVLAANFIGQRLVKWWELLLARIPRFFGLAWLGANYGKDAWPWIKSHGWHMGGIAIALFAGIYLAIRFLAHPERKTVAATE